MHDEVLSSQSSVASKASHAEPTEDTPLLERKASEAAKWKGSSVVLRVLLTSFLVSLSFSVTQVPLIYVFGVMTCEEYYKTHPEPPAGFNRCRNHQIEASTAQSVALLGATTTLFGVVNLFFTGWSIKALGVKRALLLTVFFPALRLAVQNVGVQVGAGLGIIIVQSSQAITVIGGPAGYLLALNSFATEVVESAERTATLGRLSGCAMFGTALGYLAGGYLGDVFDIIAPFRVTLALFLTSCLYILIFLPNIKNSEAEKKAVKSLSGFFDPLKLFLPRKWVLRDGIVRTEYGVLFLGVGTFLGVLATSYIPVLLQMYSTDIFNFGTAENGWLISLNSLVRGLFLTLAFPSIISRGRKWLDRRISAKSNVSAAESGIPDLPTEPQQMADVPSMEPELQPVEPPKPHTDDSFAFDLWFTKYSLITDGVLTGLATFTTQGYQMYLIAVILPLASGTGPAAKGTVLQMCPAEQRADALSAISLIELIARMASTGVFGLIFSGFADIGHPNLTFACNAGIAVFGFAFLMLVRFPPDGSIRYIKSESDGEGTGANDG